MGEMGSLQDRLRDYVGSFEDGYLKRMVTEAAARLDQLEEAADLAVQECLPVLPLEGAWPSYRFSGRADSEVRALPEEWASAATAIADLGQALEATPRVQQPDA